jgi:tRNA nucleotidyltransferase/poly(A) polymerase
MKLSKMHEFSHELKKIFNTIKTAGGEGRFVGGAVRNFLMYKTPLEGGDVDIAVNMPVEVVCNIFTKIGAKVITKYATNIVVLNHKVFEITSTRKDENCDGRYADMIFTPFFEEDAKRRDFTINALYMNEYGEVFDYFNGMEDIKNGVVRFIGNPEFRIEEDGLRIWRFFRFSCLYAKSLNEEGLLACIKKKDILVKISKERVTAEMTKLLNGEEEKVKFILHKMIEGNILKEHEWNLNSNLPKDAFERLLTLNNGNFCEAFLYTSKQKKFINLYNSVRHLLKEKWEVCRLFYILMPDLFNSILNVGTALNEFIDNDFGNLPVLPFSKQSIMREGFAGGNITKEFDRRLEDFCKHL